MKITTYEHQKLTVGTTDKGNIFEVKHLKALQRLYGDGKKKPYYTLINNGIKFCQYVGVLQVGNLQIEVLPKADDSPEKPNEDKNKSKWWRNLLIDMLRVAGYFDVKAPSSSSLHLKSNSILELYFEIFISEVEYLLRSGLIKQYRRTEGNHYALKGALLFPKHIQKNLVHQERFYTRSVTYDKEHIWHIILYQAIKVIKNISNNARLHNRIGALELLFPEMPDKKISEKTFVNLKYTRKTEAYRQTIEIARLIIIQYHPDLKSGKNNVLAIMFDMNKLWEKFVYVSLRRSLDSGTYDVLPQKKEDFWATEEGKIPEHNSYLKPDILIKTEGGFFILDTKWKVISDMKPSAGDLQQMFAYSEYFDAKKVALVYPNKSEDVLEGAFIKEPKNQCSVININCKVEDKSKENNSAIKNLQDGIVKIKEWIEKTDI